MREDQHPAGLRGLDEAECRDRLSGARRVLEPEALGCVGILGLLGERASSSSSSSTQSRGSSSPLCLDLLLGRVVPVEVEVVSRLLLLVLLVLLIRGGALYGAEILIVVGVVGVLAVVLLVLLLVLLVLALLRWPCRRAPRARGGVVGAEDVGGRQQLRRRGCAGLAVAAGALRCASASSAVSVPDRAST